MKVEIHKDISAFDELSPWWNSQPGPVECLYLRSEWFRAIAANLLSEGDELEVVVLSKGDRPLAALPLVRNGRRSRSLTDTSTETFDLVGSHTPRAIEQILDNLRDRTYLRLEALPDSSPLVSATGQIPRWRVQRRRQLAYIDLAGGKDGINSQLSRTLRRNLRRGQSRLSELGDVVWSPLARSDIRELLEEGFALEEKGWRGREGVAVNKLPARRRFMLSLTDLAERQGWLRLSSLRLDGKLVAFNYRISYQGRVHGLLTTYDEDLPSKCSAGHVLIWKTVESALEEGCRVYELGTVEGPGAWKRSWSEHTETRSLVIGFGNRPIGWLAHKAWLARTWKTRRLTREHVERLS